MRAAVRYEKRDRDYSKQKIAQVLQYHVNNPHKAFHVIAARFDVEERKIPYWIDKHLTFRPDSPSTWTIILQSEINH